MQVEIVQYFDGEEVSCPIAAATVLAKGDFISVESNAGVNLDAAADDATFLGISDDESDSTQSDDIQVLLKCHILVDVTSGTYGLLGGLKWAAGDSGTDYSLVADGGANTIAWSLTEETSAVTRLRVLIDTLGLHKLAASDA